MDEKFNLLYTGFLVLEEGYVKVAMLTFINERNCITTKKLAVEVEKEKEKYLAETLPCPAENRYNIFSVFYPMESQYVAAFYGMLKVSSKI